MADYEACLLRAKPDGGDVWWLLNYPLLTIYMTPEPAVSYRVDEPEPDETLREFRYVGTAEQVRFYEEALRRKAER